MPVRAEVRYSVEKKELVLLPAQVKECVTIYDKTSRVLRSTEYVFYHYDGKHLHIVFLRKGEIEEISSASRRSRSK